MNRGADPNIPGRYRSQNYLLLKPYCIADKKKYSQITDYLTVFGHKMDIFSYSYLGKVQKLKGIISQGKEVINKRQKEDKIWHTTPLHFAIAGNQKESAHLLLTAGANVEVHSRLLFEIACRENRLDLIQMLFEFGGDPKKVDVPPVFHHGNVDIVDFFVNNGLDADKLFGIGWPPIVYMCRGDKGEHPEKISLLLKHVTKINAKTPTGLTAIHAASKSWVFKSSKSVVRSWNFY